MFALAGARPTLKRIIRESRRAIPALSEWAHSGGSGANVLPVHYARCRIGPRRITVFFDSKLSQLRRRHLTGEIPT